MFSFSLSFSVNLLLAYFTIVPIALLHCLWASDVKSGVAGLRKAFIFSFMCIGVIAWFVEVSG